MKKYVRTIVSLAIVFAIVLSPRVNAQDATYSCGAYGAGNYSTNDCTEDSGGGSDDEGTSTTSGGIEEGSTSGGIASGGSTTNDNSDSDSKSGDEASSNEPLGGESGGGIFAVIFAKLVSSWGWVLFFSLLLVGGIVLIGWARRRQSADN